MNSPVKVKKDYQITLPRRIRQALNVKPGDTVYLNVTKNKILVHPTAKSLTEYMSGLGKEVWQQLGGAKTYLHKERTSWD
jgi:AbrB family looped-hinge helix DNA binding protein